VSILDISRRNIVIDTYIIHTDNFCTYGEKIILLLKCVFSEVRARTSCFIILYCSIPMCLNCFSSCTLSHVTVYTTLSWFTHSSSGTIVADVRKYTRPNTFIVSYPVKNSRIFIETESLLPSSLHSALSPYYDPSECIQNFETNSTTVRWITTAR
jgi:hypothetical protein